MPAPELSGSSAADGGCRAAFHRVVLLDLLDPQSPFLVFVRKLCVLCYASEGLLVAFGFASFLAGVASRNADGRARGVTTGDVLNMVYLTLSVLARFVPYFYVAKTHAVPDWVVVLNLFGITTSNVLGAFYLPYFPFAVTCCGVAIFGAITDIPGRGLLFALLSVLFAVSAYNITALITGRAPLAVEGYDKAEMTVMLTFFAMGFVELCVPVVACALHMRHLQALLAGAKAANALSRDVADQLSVYATDGVSAALEEYAALPGADPELVDSYEALVANLNRYRPHLPNWMVRQPGDRVLLSPSSSRSSERSPLASDMARSSNPLDAPDPAPAPASPRAVDSGDDVAVPPNEAVADDEFEVLGLACSAPVTRSAAFAIVEFRVGAHLSPAEHSAVASDFVDWIHFLAATTRGALHCFVGDTVQLSWNAAAPCPMPAVKAAGFLAELKTATAQDRAPGELSLAAALACGPATSQFSGSGQHSAFLLSLPWRAKLDACLALARRHRAFVCTGAVANAARHAVVTRPAELLAVLQNGEEAAVAVHEVLGKPKLDVVVDEWMYGGGASGDEGTDVLALCSDGFYTDALVALGPPAAGAPPLVADLRARIEEARVNPPRRFATHCCSCGGAELQETHAAR
jgi:hypothetical protein